MTDARETPVLFLDGPLSLYVYPAAAKDILEAFERLRPLVQTAALEAQKRMETEPGYGQKR